MSQASNNFNRKKGFGNLPLKPVSFTFDGKSYQGLEGDTLASALLANGVHLMGRSFKYHRPRGILAAGPEEPNALMNVARDNARQQPNVRASVQEIYDGLKVKSQNRWPSLAFDTSAANDRLSNLFPAGFYYKTFMWPRKAWDKLYEPIIRKAAGLGVSPSEPDPDRYSNRFAHCEVLVLGGGLSGISAALEAAKSGARVILVDENPALGGSALSDRDLKIDGKPAGDWIAKTTAKLKAMDNVTVLSRTTAFGYYAQNLVALVERVTEHMARPSADLPRERLWQVRAKQVILATGAIERHMVFADNDRPGIMLASAARTFLNRYGVTVGSKVGVYTANDSAYAAAFDLAKAGAEIAMIVDTRDEIPQALLDQADAQGIRVMKAHAVIGSKGRLRISSMIVSKIGSPIKDEIEVDALITSAGWTPSVHLYSQSRGKVVWDEATSRFLPGVHPQATFSVGACNGTDRLADAISEAQNAATEAVKRSGGKASKSNKAVKVENDWDWSGGMIGAGDGAEEGKNVKAFVDFQNDVTAKDIRLAVKEGFHSIEHVKRFTTNGMATDQGKTSNMHGLAIAAETLGKPLPQVGLTTFRSPYTPVTFGAIVNHARGPLFDPARKTPIHGWAEENGAVFEDVGNWKRAWYFPQAGEDMHQAVNRECVATRKSVGIFDASTLGKIEIVGPDAAEFMNRLYINAWDKLAVGRAKYGIMCREDGFIFDDGVIGRMAPDRFHVTTTTGGAPRVLAFMEDYLQTEFPELDVWLTSTSEQWAVIALNGPNARKVIEPLVQGIDLSPEKFPHMSVREGKICGVETRLFRISFSGEMGFEINVPANHGRAVWEAIYASGQKYGITPYGTETMHVLRAEKGFIIVGQDTDGTVTPYDAGLGWAVSKKKPDFVGKRGLMRKDLVAKGRPQLVGLRTKDPNIVLEEGAQIVADPNQPVPMKMIGFVTSSYWSEVLGHSIAMALVEGGNEMMGETLHVPMPNSVIDVEICAPIFYDPKMERVNG